MSDAIATPLAVLIGVVVLCFASIVLAVKVKGDKVIVWRGFGVAFMVSPCRRCPLTDSDRQVVHQPSLEE